MKKNLFTLSALCLAAMTLIFSGCKKENNDPQEPAKVQTYKMSIQASKGTDSQANGPRRVLSLDGNTLNATWKAGEQVSVYNATKGKDLTGYLVAQSNGSSVQLEGELTGTIEAGDKLTLKYLSPSYATQEGTIAYISEHCDYAVAENVEVTSISGETIYTVGEATFENRQAVVKFTLLNKADDAALSTTQLVVKVGEDTYTVTPASATSEMFVALPGFAGQTVTLTATVGSDTYAYEKTGATFANGKFYPVTAKLTKQAPPAPEGAISGKFSVSSSQKVYFAKGNLKYTQSTEKFEFMTNQYDMVETNGDVGNNYASQDVISLFGWATSNLNTPVANTNYLPTNTNTTFASYGSGITTANVNWSDNGNEFANYDWGANTGDLGTGWRTLTNAEWVYLFSRTGDEAATVDGTADCRYTKATINTDGTAVQGIILFPDGGTFAASEFAAVGSPNTADADYTTTCTTAQWTALQTKGCVFLPAAGWRSGTSVDGVGSGGIYWSSTSYVYNSWYALAYVVSFEGGINAGGSYVDLTSSERHAGRSVRLVRNVE
ncbi:MAG: hypothetical protein IJ249_04440 [Paludibacteraceae bacterium]|nr:hypothetical protein [Paludibacteraceae bacterium]